MFWILIPTAIIAIFFAKNHTWSSVFVANSATQSGTVNATWYTLCQVVCESNRAISGVPDSDISRVFELWAFVDGI